MVVLQVLQAVVFLYLYWMDGNTDSFAILNYAFLINVFFLGCYLVYRYASQKRYYERLSRPLETLEETFEQLDMAPVPEAFTKVLHSQYKLYQERLKRAEQQQKEHLKYIDMWVHHMKTPLSVIELTAEQLDEPESSNVREETDRMKIGLNKVLYMARLRTIDRDFAVAPVHVAGLVHDVNQEHKRYFIRHEVYPHFTASRPDIIVESDEKWLRFILSQLIENAVKYSAGKSNRVDIKLYENSNGAVLDVCDYGVGISKTDVRRVFDAFFTGENGRRFRESTGMGLFLSKQAALYLGHKLEVNTQQEKGTTFRIVFPTTQNLTSM
ncbi:signal transduction histidine kinase [Aureibacillus halotolerans]|uniref:histidine kinase n=1 Tax=Aureibacillus halotolerans TaxID=1508390 RepID=A0A4R6U7X0_9BACI|nr:signal transduction histidine kinase [Aureibacillus halotolerans]